jgi:hypothetical protein
MPWLGLMANYILINWCDSCSRSYLDVCFCKTIKTRRIKEKVSKQIELNLDRHCGVYVPSTNTYCLRSLKCKSHSVHLKRSVKGRSKPFDILLSEMRMLGSDLNSAKYEKLEIEFNVPYECTREWKLDLDPLDRVLKCAFSSKRQLTL